MSRWRRLFRRRVVPSPGSVALDHCPKCGHRIVPTPSGGFGHFATFPEIAPEDTGMWACFAFCGECQRSREK